MSYILFQWVSYSLCFWWTPILALVMAFWSHEIYAIYAIFYLFDAYGIWVGFPRTEMLPVLCHFKKNCWPAVAKPDLLGHFSQLFWGKHDCHSTLPQPQPLTNKLQCTRMHPNSPKCTELYHFLKTLLDRCIKTWFSRPLPWYAHNHCSQFTALHVLLRKIEKSGLAGLATTV